jgi:hypothetical protein
VLPLEGGADDDVGLLDEDVGGEEADVGEDVLVEEGDVEDGALEEGGEDEGEVVGELEEVGADEVGAAALRLVDDIKDRGPELKRITEREAMITRDRISDFLPIVTLVSLLPSLRLFLSLLPAGPAIY